MSLPTFRLNISGNLLALYGAVLSTVTALVQIMNHFRDRVKVVLKQRRNMTAIGMGPQSEGMTMTLITATNAGRRPVTINGFSCRLLHEKGRQETDWYLKDVRPALPYEITEGREVTAFLNDAGVNFEAIAYWYAWSSTGREFRLYVAP